MPSYIEGILTKESQKLVEEHIQSCQSCREVLASMETDLSLKDEQERIIRLTSKKPYKKIKNRFLLLLFSSILILITVVFGGYFYITRATYNEVSVVIHNVEIDQTSAYIEGSSINSSPGFSHFEYFLEDGILYIELKYTRLTGSKSSSGDFELEINEDFSLLNKIFLKGETEGQYMLIWNRDDE